jgi:hypothetical protein
MMNPSRLTLARLGARKQQRPNRSRQRQNHSDLRAVEECAFPKGEQHTSRSQSDGRPFREIRHRSIRATTWKNDTAIRRLMLGGEPRDTWQSAFVSIY